MKQPSKLETCGELPDRFQELVGNLGLFPLCVRSVRVGGTGFVRSVH